METKLTNSPKWVSWIPPYVGFIKLNTDGSVNRASSLAAIGGILRNDKREWLFGFSMNVGSSSVFAAKLWGVWERLKLSTKHNLYGTKLEVDSSIVVQVLQKGVS
ncbi:Ribonuclease H domain [Dillenia turbinata]|uniref:Ribonuclease H domain n=1 Tax=Dillenia turbinata TaxID=194707 RepID=A0AAN8YWV2_9MAGN